jgi:hypothetical protein
VRRESVSVDVETDQDRIDDPEYVEVCFASGCPASSGATRLRDLCSARIESAKPGQHDN